MALKKRDYYTVLGVGHRARLEEIKKAFHEQVMRHHPDKNPGNKLSEILFMELNEAYNTLKDREKRAEYDYSLQLETKAPEDLPVETLRTLFGKVDSPDKGKWVGGFNAHLLHDKKEGVAIKKILMVGLPALLAYALFQFIFAHSASPQGQAPACTMPRTATVTLLGDKYHAAFTKEADHRWDAHVLLNSGKADTIHLNTDYVKIFANFTGDAPASNIGYPYIEEQSLTDNPARAKADMDITLEWNCNGQKQTQSYSYKTGN